jgi:solute carrier family 50 protein (sugar transporter)
MGCLVATAMFAAPIADLRRGLLRQSLGDLNPRPWAVMTGNCLGWCAYAYYIHDPFILASNVPGFILSCWLNMGAAKLEYKQMTTSTSNSTSATGANTTNTTNTASGGSLRHRPVPLLDIENDPEEMNDEENEIENDQNSYYNVPSSLMDHHHGPSIIFTPQEVWWLRVLMLWSITLVWVGWISPYKGYEAATVGLLVNINLIFFYGVPLQTIRTVLRQGHSNSIHPASMVMACGNATFWLLYGIALWDPVLMVPNSVGLALGLCQVVLCIVYPKQRQPRRVGGETADATTMHTMNNGVISMTNLPNKARTSTQPQQPSDGLFRDLQLSTNQPSRNYDEDDEDDDDGIS